MSLHLCNVVQFRGDRLFNGAVNIQWFSTDIAKSKTASAAFVFHGPQYHGVQQEDVGSSHGHRLIDTANFTRAVVRRCYGREDAPFTLAIAGYGTGKSHLGLTLASLLQSPQGESANQILSALEAADNNIGAEVRAYLQESGKPCLVVALNGVQSFDLTAEITRQIVRVLRCDGYDSKPLEDLRPRFGQAAGLIRMSNHAVIKELLSFCDASSMQELIQALEQQDEMTYARVHNYFADHGMPIRALAGESVREVIELAIKEYCGEKKPYRSLLILFDEFGKYTEFATIRSQIAGGGVLQDLFEAIQAHSSHACFVGFIQFELNAYVQRVAPEFRNEILRYVTRYQAAIRVYLSINLETLIANLLEKRDSDTLDRWFEKETARAHSRVILSRLSRWFPQSKNHRLWSEPGPFHTMIRKGCWPLSPYSMWFLFYLAAAGKHLQERSALALLAEVLDRYAKTPVPDSGNFVLAPVDLWSEALLQELLLSEEAGQQGSITHSFSSVTARHGAKLSTELKKVLCAVVLASKLGLQVTDQKDAADALGELAGLSLEDVQGAIRLLQHEYNVLEWDQAFKAYDILGDAVPRTQFLAFLRHKVSEKYDEAGMARLFAVKAGIWCELLGDLECDFAEENRILTREWKYLAVTTNLDYLAQNIKIAAERWSKSVAVDEPRGTIIYTYVEQSRNPEAVLADATHKIRSSGKEHNRETIPILVVLLCDEKGLLGQSLAEYDILEEQLSPEDKVRFGNLVGAHKEKLKQGIYERTEALLKQRRICVSLKQPNGAGRLATIGKELFSSVYTQPIPFPFDGFGTAKGNAADCCCELTSELLHGKLDYNSVLAKPTKTKNRAITVLKDSWGIFNKNGDVSRRPSHTALRRITEGWDDAIADKKRRISIGEMVAEICQPPYGANLASAGLILGTFIAPRYEDLIVEGKGSPIAVSLWIQQEIFRGKFLDLSVLTKVFLTDVGETSSEWENLLDEWEQTETHLGRQNCLLRAEELQKRISIPPTLTYRELHLREQSLSSLKLLSGVQKSIQEALEKIDRGMEKQDVSFLASGTGDLKEVRDKMTGEKPLWTDAQIKHFQSHFEKARQAIVMYFPQWITGQRPKNDSQTATAYFKHKMLNQVSNNLKKINLLEQAQKTEDHTQKVIRKSELFAEGVQLLREVQSWMKINSDYPKLVRIAEIQGLTKVGGYLLQKMREMGQRVDLPELPSVYTRLEEFIVQLKVAESNIRARATVLWQMEIQTEEDIVNIMRGISQLTSAYENLPEDLADFQQKHHALKRYQFGYEMISNENLSWNEYEKACLEVEQQITANLRDREIPWPVSKTMKTLAQLVSNRRKARSEKWILAVAQDSVRIDSMDVGEATRLHDKLMCPPPILIEDHRKKLDEATDRVRNRLEEIKIDWLIEKFKELSPSLRKKFLNMVAET